MLNVGNPLAYGLDTVMDLQGRLRDVERVGPSKCRSLSSWHAQLFLSRLFVSWQRSFTEVAVRRALKKDENKNKREEEQEEVC